MGEWMEGTLSYESDPIGRVKLGRLLNWENVEEN
jgi:hypothetical protein